jgi:hypothetical protein
MSGHATLTYRDLDKAYAFMRASRDDHGEVAADHPEFYRTVTASGTRRAPLPALSDREPCSFRDEEDALIARIDGDVETVEDAPAENDITFEFRELTLDDLDAMDGSSWEDQEYHAAWQEHVDGIADAIGQDRKVPSIPPVPVTYLREETAVPPADVPADADDGPAAISGWRATIASNEELNLDNGTGGYKCWKDTTKAPTQFTRHAGRVQPTFRRGPRTAA